MESCENYSDSQKLIKIRFFEIFSVYLKPMFFKYHHVVGNYFCCFLGSDSNLINFRFALIFPLGLLFSRERHGYQILFPDNDFACVILSWRLNCWRSELFWESFGLLSIYLHVPEAQAQRSFRLNLILFFSLSLLIYGRRIISSTFNFNLHEFFQLHDKANPR